MFWADRISKLAGITLLLLVVLGLIGTGLLETLALGDNDPTARGDVEGLLRDINDNKALFMTGLAFDHASNALVLLAAPLLYLLLRDRSQPLAFFTFIGLAAAGIAFLASDAASMAVGLLAADFLEEGGAGGLAAGDPAILQSARAVAAFAGLVDLVGLTPLALGFVALGALLGWAPEAEFNPPRWLGGLAVVSGVSLLLSWVTLASIVVGAALSAAGIIGSLLLLVILGGWLVLQPERHSELVEARRAVAPADV